MLGGDQEPRHPTRARQRKPSAKLVRIGSRPLSLDALSGPARFVPEQVRADFSSNGASWMPSARDRWKAVKLPTCSRHAALHVGFRCHRGMRACRFTIRKGLVSIGHPEVSGARFFVGHVLCLGPQSFRVVPPPCRVFLMTHGLSLSQKSLDQPALRSTVAMDERLQIGRYPCAL
jgi:hypothetical protein